MRGNRRRSGSFWAAILLGVLAAALSAAVAIVVKRFGDGDYARSLLPWAYLGSAMLAGSGAIIVGMQGAMAESPGKRLRSAAIACALALLVYVVALAAIGQLLARAFRES